MTTRLRRVTLEHRAREALAERAGAAGDENALAVQGVIAIHPSVDVDARQPGRLRPCQLQVTAATVVPPPTFTQ